MKGPSDVPTENRAKITPMNRLRSRSATRSHTIISIIRMMPLLPPSIPCTARPPISIPVEVAPPLMPLPSTKALTMLMVS